MRRFALRPPEFSGAFGLHSSGAPIACWERIASEIVSVVLIERSIRIAWLDAAVKTEGCGFDGRSWAIVERFHDLPLVSIYYLIVRSIYDCFPIGGSFEWPRKMMS